MSDQGTDGQRYDFRPRTNRPTSRVADNVTGLDSKASNCPLCPLKDTLEMVKCDKCNKKYHYLCVSVDPSVAPENWHCNNCFMSDTGKNCSLCNREDAVLMLECMRCNNLYHFPCVGADVSIDTKHWICRKCVPETTSITNRSVHSSTSSRRRGALQLEKLAREKAIQDALIAQKSQLVQQQAAVDTEFLQKEYEIRENMSGSEDGEVASVRSVAGDKYVTDWLNSTSAIPSKRPMTMIELQEDIRTMRGQVWNKVFPNPPSSEIRDGDLQLIPPKQVQFAHPLLNESADRNSGTSQKSQNSTVIEIGIGNGNPNDNSTQQIDAVVQNIVPSSSSHTANQIPDLSTKSFVPNYVDQQQLTPTPFVLNSAQRSPNRMQPDTPQQSFANTSVYGQPISNVPVNQPLQSTTSERQQASAPMSPHGYLIDPNIAQPPRFSSLRQDPPIVTDTNVQQPSILTSTIPPQQFMSTSCQRQTIPVVSMYQQPVVSSTINPQQIPNFFQQQLFGPSLTPHTPPLSNSNYGQTNVGQSTSGLCPQPQVTTSQWLIYDPQLNPQQLPPTRLQLAARQSMPKDFPKFNGSPEQWSIFHNAYVNYTTTCGLSNGENLPRIERCLEEPARKAVLNLLTRPEAVPDIIETLKILYGRPEASIESQLKVIRSEAAPKMNKMETFIDFAMSVRNVTSEIQKTGMWQYLWNPQLIQELVDKLPSQMRMEWGQIIILSPNVNLGNLSEWLFQKARTACAVTMPSSIERKPAQDKSKPNGHVNTHSKNSNHANSSKSGGSSNSNTKSCHACNGKSHDIYECRKFLGMPLNDKWETVKSNKLCRICLERHHVLRCESQSLCGESGCTVKHHRLLHNPAKMNQTATPNEKKSSQHENVHSAHQQSKIGILRRYMPVILHGPKGSVNVIAFFDDGSDMTLVENQVIHKLGITGVPTDLFLEWTAKIVRREPNSKSITLKISGTRTPNKQYEITDARTVKSLDLPSQTIDIDQLRETYQFLRRIPIESYTDETPKILIGLRDCKLTTPLRVRSGEWHEPIATKTLLGWEVHGSDAPSSNVTNLNCHNERSHDDDLHRMVAEFFSLDNFGVRIPEQTLEAVTEKRARQLLETTTKRIGNRFETGLLWKYDDVRLPDSLPMATRRLVSLEKRLQNDPDLASKFRAKFQEYIEKGYVRKLTTEEEADTNEKTWYLPLFPVTNTKKPGKVRLVWDAAAKVSNISLNSMLLSGPDLLVSLQGVLYRFRQGAVAVTGDIREMFHQISILEKDQTSQRFLWREQSTSKIDVYVLQVMSFGATCSPSSAQYVKNTNALEFVEQYPIAEAAIRHNTYVDDWLQAFDTEAEAENVANQVKEIYARGGFEIRNWLSNSVQVSRNLGANTNNEQALCIGSNENQTERILGMWWNVNQDSFTYSLRFNPINREILLNIRRPTKREALRTLMSVYDPLGFLAAYLVHLKMILQDMWRIGMKWDEKIKEKDDDGLYDRWQNWINLLPEIEHIKINRHYSNKINSRNPTRIELHVFVDAGDLAYATVAYFRIEDSVNIECALIGGKTKVAPLKPLSVPRMELQAAVLGARFKNSILQNHTLEIVRTVIWSDSSTVLSWLRSDLRKYTQFVGARIGEILETTSLIEWRYVPSKLNPADDATKWNGPLSLDRNSRWFKGPDFLLQSEEYWPTQKANGETKEELRPKYVHVHQKHEVSRLPIKFEQIWKWKRTMAFVIRFVNNVKARIGKNGFTIRTGPLKRIELQKGETSLYRIAQYDEFAPEICKLRDEVVPDGERKSVDKTSLLYRYSPYLDGDGVLRMRGRIDAASNVSYDQKRPIILPTKHQITDLIVNEYHIRYKHQNTETVINEIKQKFIIPRLRVLFKRIRRNCQHCKNASVQPNPPEMAQLPTGRLASFTRPYTSVGIDYAGPYKITQFRRTVKRWVVLFTCLTIRSVYIDVVESLTTDSCIMAINRFIARNGRPEEFWSDRGTSFVGANNELAREIAKIDHDLLATSYTNCYTQWNFNPPYAQYMGGAWERLIGSMKNTLEKILPKTHYPNHETFVTALTEVENIINSRPLTFVSIEPDDPEALTPNHFLKGSSNGNKPPGIFPPPPATLRGNWRYAQQIANEFWHKWVKEYLPMITRRTKWFDNVKPIEVGDQVIIVDETAPRNMWDRGVVIETLKSGSDGRISRVNVRTTDGIYTRPVSKLAVLDLEKPEAKTLTRETLAGRSVTASSDM